jgi:adenylate cyclase
MQKAPNPHDERERLAALYKLNILDTKPEERFDRITNLVKLIFEVPITYVAMIDANRQWFKSSCGLSSSETPREVSFCSHTILRDDALIIRDALADARFSDSPLVTEEPHIRFYAGCPLRSAGGHKVATLCIADHTPREFRDEQRDLLLNLGRLVEDQFKLEDVLKLQEDLVTVQRDLRKVNTDLEKKNSFIKNVLGRYMTDEVAEEILARPESLDLGGTKRKVTVVMSDLRGFTPMSELLSSEKVVEVLNKYLGVMVRVIHKYDGNIDSFIGDGILTVFGAPLGREDDAERAVACAVEMQLAMNEVNGTLKAEGLPPLAMGIGINTGEVIAGNIGSSERMKYSVIGSPVNLAARIESFTLGGQILISKATLNEVKDSVRVDGRLRVKIKGIEGPVAIYDIGGISGRYAVALPDCDM